jgi:hypothetical protein
MVLVGKRAWATEQKKKLPKVDLLYVYSNSQIEQIKQSKGFNNEILPDSEKPLDNPYDFTDDEDEEENPKNEKIKPTKTTNTQHTTHNTHTTHTTKKVETFNDLDFDDI